MERARAIQQEYWTPNPEEKGRLVESGRLSWDDGLRLLHLACLDMVSTGPGKEQLEADEPEPGFAPAGSDRKLVANLVAHLSSKASPYRPRHAALWQGGPTGSQEREPDLHGVLGNASLTHLGCLEVIRLDEHERPDRLEFVPLDALSGVAFASPALFRHARISYDDGRPDELALAPLLYGISWLTPHAFDRDGTMTRFICAMESSGGGPSCRWAWDTRISSFVARATGFSALAP